jgi:hypothetical protein
MQGDPHAGVTVVDIVRDCDHPVDLYCRAWAVGGRRNSHVAQARIRPAAASVGRPLRVGKRRELDTLYAQRLRPPLWRSQHAVRGRKRQGDGCEEMSQHCGV